MQSCNERPLSQPLFLNRQTFYLRPDRARVVVRPFKPAIEPRDLNPTDKTRANHILDRVLGLEPAAVNSIEGRALKTSMVVTGTCSTFSRRVRSRWKKRRVDLQIWLYCCRWELRHRPDGAPRVRPKIRKPSARATRDPDAKAANVRFTLAAQTASRRPLENRSLA